MGSEIIVTGEDNDDSATEESEHAAAVSEGAASVHEDNAEQAAGEAEQSADVATSAAGASQDGALVASAAAEAAADSAARSEAARDEIVSALNRQTEVIGSLVDELRASNAKPEPKATTERPKPDTEPKPKRRSLAAAYYGKRKGRE